MKREGFSLTEVMIIVVAIGVLLGIVIPSVIRLTDISREKATKANRDRLELAICDYYQYNDDVWPDGYTVGDGDGVLTGEELVSALVPDYLDTIPYVILKRSAPNRRSNVIYTNQMPNCSDHGSMCVGSLPTCPEHGTITDDGGWWYHVGNHILRVNSLQRDTAGILYSDYGFE
jgi:type II secretory pathway pseudopilin PulG